MTSHHPGPNTKISAKGSSGDSRGRNLNLPRYQCTPRPTPRNRYEKANALSIEDIYTVPHKKRKAEPDAQKLQPTLSDYQEPIDSIPEFKRRRMYSEDWSVPQTVPRSTGQYDKSIPTIEAKAPVPNPRLRLQLPNDVPPPLPKRSPSQLPSPGLFFSRPPPPSPIYAIPYDSIEKSNGDLPYSPGLNKSANPSGKYSMPFSPNSTVYEEPWDHAPWSRVAFPDIGKLNEDQKQTVEKYSDKSNRHPSLERNEQFGLQLPIDPYIKSMNVYGLNRETFSTFIKDKAVLLVMFYASTLSGGKKEKYLKKQFAKTASKTSSFKHMFAGVDCTNDPALCDAQNVYVFPQVKLYSKGTLIQTITDESSMGHSALQKLILSCPVLENDEGIVHSCQKIKKKTDHK